MRYGTRRASVPFDDEALWNAFSSACRGLDRRATESRWRMPAALF
jgi:hypothetical protein